MINTKKSVSASRKGFTLIEMLVVISVIAVLAGITLTGVGGFTSRARDTKRVADVRSIQNYLEFFVAKCGYYPGSLNPSGTCASGAPGSWANFQSSLSSFGKIPNDPVATRTYFYAVDASNTRYIIGTKLENDNNILRDPAEIDSLPAGGTYTFTTGSSSSDCNDASGTYGYCIGS